MQLLETKKENYIGQADPFILESSGRYYIYTTGDDGIYAYSSDDLLTGWQFHGMVFTVPGEHSFWAPSVIELDGTYYMYCSYEFFGDTPDQGGHREALFVSQADNPLGPFGQEKQILHPFSIDSQIVQNESGLYLFYSTNTFEGGHGSALILWWIRCWIRTPRQDTRCRWWCPPWTRRSSVGQIGGRARRASTGTRLRAPATFGRGDWEYVMYSGNCYLQPTYYMEIRPSQDGRNGPD